MRGDLDNIVLMARRRDPVRRYASVEQFAADIRRHLDGRPVLARPDTFGYRGAKFVARNKLVVTAAALILLALLGGIVATPWQARALTLLFDRLHAACNPLPSYAAWRRRITRTAQHLESCQAELDRLR
ncbi:MAG: hypothetical protein ACKV2V_10260 [Blastocatellia bacterium]